MQYSNKHDQKRVHRLKKTLAKAKEQALEARRYLIWNDRPREEMYPLEDALVHIENALERLGVNVDDNCMDGCGCPGSCRRATDEEAVVLQ